MSNRPLHKSLKFFLKNNFFDSIKSFKDLEKKIRNIKSLNQSKTEQLKGDAMEIFVEALINNLDVFEAKKVYPSLKQTPVIIRKKMNISKIPKDKGVDGVYINNHNKIVAYQVKFRSDNEKTSYEGISKFNNQGKLADTRYLIDNSKNVNDEYFNYDRKNNLAFNKIDFDNLSKNEIIKIISWLKQKPIKFKKSTPDPKYQIDIINDVVEEFKIKDRATMLMACGSGKTLVSMWIAQKMKSNTIVIFAPSLALIKQIHDEWQREVPFKKIIKIFICSHLGDTTEYDEQILTQEEVPFKVTTDYINVREFLNKSFNGNKIIFCSYQSSRVLHKAMQPHHSIDLGIFDEAHRTTQYKKFIDKKNLKNFKINWSLGLFDKNIKINKRLFMTATSKVTKRNEHYKDGDDKVVYVMNNPNIYGNQVCNFTFVKAREIGAICPYTVIISVITKKDLSKYALKTSGVLIDGEIVKSEQVALQLAIKQAIKKYKLKKIFTFHNRCEWAESFTKVDKPEGIKTHIKDYETLYIDGSMPMRERKDVLELFETYEKSIISNARCLVEGVNIPSVDLVTFVQPKSSPTDIAQASGRAMRIRGVKDKKMGYILVPLFLEKYSGEKLIEATKNTQFEKVIKVLRALGEYDEELSDEISQKIIRRLRKGKNPIGSKRKRNKKKNPKKTELKILSQSKYLSDKIDIDILNQYKKNITWEKYIALLLDYSENHSINPIPKEISNKKFKDLGLWINRVIYRKRLGFLTTNRVNQLEEIGMKWILDQEEIKEEDYNLYFSAIDKSKDHGLGETTLQRILEKNNFKTKNGYGATKSFNLVFRKFFLKNEYEKLIKENNIIEYKEAQEKLKYKKYVNAKSFAKLAKTKWRTFLGRLRNDKNIVVPKYTYLKYGFQQSGFPYPYGMIFEKKQLNEYKYNLDIKYLEIPKGYVSTKDAMEMGIERANLYIRKKSKHKKKYYLSDHGSSLHKRGGEVTKIYKINEINKLLKLKGLSLTKSDIKTRQLITPSKLKKQIKRIFNLEKAYNKWLYDKMIIPAGGGFQKNSKKIIYYFEKNETDLIKKRLIKKYTKRKQISNKDKIYFNKSELNKLKLYLDQEVANKLKFTGKNNEIITRIRILRKSHNLIHSGKLIVGKDLGSPAFLTHKNEIDKIKNTYGIYKSNYKGYVITSNELSYNFRSMSGYVNKVRNGELKSHGFFYKGGRIVFLLKYQDIYKTVEKEIIEFPKRKDNLLKKLQKLKKKFKIT